MKTSIRRVGLFSIALISLSLPACNSKYNSRAQAFTACREWKEKGETVAYSYLFEDYLSWSPAKEVAIRKRKSTLNSRSCVLEKETRQFLGYQGKFVNFKSGVYAVDEPQPKVADKKVIKHFYY